MHYDVHTSNNTHRSDPGEVLADACSAVAAATIVEALLTAHISLAQARKYSAWCTPRGKESPRWEYTWSSHDQAVQEMRVWEDNLVISLLSRLKESSDLIRLAAKDGAEVALGKLNDQDAELLDQLEEVFEAFRPEQEAIRFKLLRQQVHLRPSDIGLIEGMLMFRRMRREPEKVLREIDTYFARQRSVRPQIQLLQTDDDQAESSLESQPEE